MAIPDYELDDLRIVSSSRGVRAMAHPVRGAVLELLLERAATVADLAAAVGRPKSSIAYHVGVLFDAGLLRVVRTRKVRAVEERFYGRTARIFYIGVVAPSDRQAAVDMNNLAVGATESLPAYDADTLRAILRHARIQEASADQFWRRLLALVNEFMQLPRRGDTVFGLVAGLYPVDHATLPEPEPEPEPERAAVDHAASTPPTAPKT